MSLSPIRTDVQHSVITVAPFCMDLFVRDSTVRHVAWIFTTSARNMFQVSVVLIKGQTLQQHTNCVHQDQNTRAKILHVSLYASEEATSVNQNLREDMLLTSSVTSCQGIGMFHLFYDCCCHCFCMSIMLIYGSEKCAKAYMNACPEKVACDAVIFPDIDLDVIFTSFVFGNKREIREYLDEKDERTSSWLNEWVIHRSHFLSAFCLLSHRFFSFMISSCRCISFIVMNHDTL